MRYVLFYESSDAVLEKAPIHGGAHRTWWNQFVADGTLLLIGPFADPRDGAMGVSTTREAAEAFANGDPFVLNGVVKSWRILEWREVVDARRPSTSSG